MPAKTEKCYPRADTMWTHIEPQVRKVNYYALFPGIGPQI
jgi:hypothetical protein